MANVGTYYVSVVPSMKGFASHVTAGIGGVNLAPTGRRMGEQLGNGAASGISASSAAIAGAFGGVAASAVDMLVGSVIDLTGEMAAASDSAQKFGTTLEFAGLDSSVIEDLTKSTQEYADQTVYDLADIRNVTAQLASNGVEGFAELAEAAGNLNAVAGGNADTFKSVGMVMTQTAGSGRLMTENWNQLTDAIPGASGALQDAMREAGAFEGNFRDAMESGEISADEFFDAVQKLGMSDVAEEAATSTETMEGALGNLQAAVVGVGSQALDAVKPMVTDTISAVAEAIQGLPEQLSQAQAIIDEQSSAWLEGAGFDPQALAQPLIDAAASIRDNLAPVLEDLLPKFQPVVDSFQSFSDTVQANLMPMLQSAADMIGTIGENLGEILAPIIETVGPMVADMGTAFGDFATTLADTVMPGLQGIFDKISEFVDVVQPILSDFIEWFLVTFMPMWNALSTVVTNAFSVISTVVGTVMGVIQGIIGTVTALISGDWGAAWTNIQNVFWTIWNGISSVVTTMMNTVSTVIGGALETIQNVWNTVWDGISSFFSDIWEGIKSGVEDAVKSVTDTVTGIKDGITGFFTGAGDWLKNAGESIINGLADGIKGAVDNVTGAIGGVLDEVRKYLPFSPAKKGPFSGRGWTVYSGESMVEGLAAGISCATPTAVGAMRSAMSDVYGASAFGGVSMRAYDGTQMSRTDAILVELLDSLPRMIRDNSPSSMTVNGREFARAVREVVPA